MNGLDGRQNVAEVKPEEILFSQYGSSRQATILYLVCDYPGLVTSQLQLVSHKQQKANMDIIW